MKPSSAVEAIVADYWTLLQEVDDWFARCQDAAGEAIRCTEGCSACCRGLFDITLLDAFLLRRGFDHLPSPVQERVRQAAAPSLEALKRRWPDFSAPWLLNAYPQEEWSDLPERQEEPCPLLSQGCCLVYPFRPLLCRLHGLPHIDHSAEPFSEEWCTLNFPGEDPRKRADLRAPFRNFFTREARLLRDFNALVLGDPRGEADTLIPAAVFIEFGKGVIGNR